MIISYEYIEASLGAIIQSKKSVKKTRKELVKFICDLREELLAGDQDKFALIHEREKHIPKRVTDMVKKKLDQIDKRHNERLQELEHLILGNISLWHNQERKVVEIETGSLAETVLEWARGIGFDDFFERKAVWSNELNKFALEAFEKEDIDGHREDTPPDQWEKRLYTDGYFWGYLQAFEDLTGENGLKG